jgi:hypothetical protein
MAMLARKRRMTMTKHVVILGMSGAMLMGGMVWAQVHVTSGFIKPTAEELAMTSLPGFPGASAVVLFREEVTNDDMHSVEHYDRIKILTKDGEKYANVELPFYSTMFVDSDHMGDDKSLGEIAGRTIHSDGRIIPLTAKPYLKVIEKQRGVKIQEKVFTLPDVELGSIIEYRYTTRIDDNMYESPNWYIQGELYLKAAHYLWYPTEKNLIDSRQHPIRSISWFPILPEGAIVQRHDLPHASLYSTGPVQYFDLVVKDVPSQVKEEYMPPIASYSYRVLFNFTAEQTAAEWWKDEGKDWSKRLDSFANPNSELKAATQTLIAGAATQDEKLKKIYAAVMALDNTHYSRAHEKREDKAEGEGKVKSAADVLVHERGTATQMTELFVGMARAAGMKAYFMLLPDRSIELFTPTWLSFQQFDDLIAIINVDGKEVFFDPGDRYCGYGHLAWEHTYVRGLRQVDGGTDFGNTSGDDYKANRTSRVANLNMNEKGQITGTIKLTFMGEAAVRWRHAALTGDDESLKHELTKDLEGMVPKSLEVKVGQIDHLKEYEQPLVVVYEVTGTLGTQTGKRLILPSDLFEVGTSAIFPDEKRVQPVYFHYPQLMQDAMRVNVPAGFSVEAVPAEAKISLPGQEVYSFVATEDAKGFTARRDYIQNELIVMPKDYDGLRKYYSQVESKDQESVVLKVERATTSAAN